LLKWLCQLTVNLGISARGTQIIPICIIPSLAFLRLQLQPLRSRLEDLTGNRFSPASSEGAEARLVEEASTGLR